LYEIEDDEEEDQRVRKRILYTPTVGEELAFGLTYQEMMPASLRIRECRQQALGNYAVACRTTFLLCLD